MHTSESIQRAYSNLQPFCLWSASPSKAWSVVSSTGHVFLFSFAVCTLSSIQVLMLVDNVNHSSLLLVRELGKALGTWPGCCRCDCHRGNHAEMNRRWCMFQRWLIKPPGVHTTQSTVANVADLSVIHLGGHAHLWCHKRQIFTLTHVTFNITMFKWTSADLLIYKVVILDCLGVESPSIALIWVCWLNYSYACE